MEPAYAITVIGLFGYRSSINHGRNLQTLQSYQLAHVLSSCPITYNNFDYLSSIWNYNRYI